MARHPKGDGGRLLTRIKQEVEQLSYKRDGGAYNPFSSLVENICSVKPVAVTDLAELKGNSVRLVLVSMPQLDFKWRAFSSLRTPAAPAGIDKSAYTRKLVAFPGSSSGRLLAAFEEALHASIVDLKANVICFSELGFPSHRLMPAAQARRLAYNAAHDHGVLIIAGSAHDARTLYNTGYAFYPGCSKSGRPFHKALSAVSAGESVGAPSQREILVINAFGLRIAILICLDIADYASLGALVRVGDRVDLLLVPCYTEKFEKMVEIARVASRALPGAAALVNTKLPHAVAGAYHIARFGKLEEAAQSKILPTGAMLSLVKIRYAEFQSERTQLKTTPVPWIEWLFGNRDSPVVFT